MGQLPEVSGTKRLELVDKGKIKALLRNFSIFEL